MQGLEQVRKSLSLWQRTKYDLARVFYWVAKRAIMTGDRLLISCIDDPLIKSVFKTMLQDMRQPAPSEYIEKGAEAHTLGTERN